MTGLIVGYAWREGIRYADKVKPGQTGLVGLVGLVGLNIVGVMRFEPWSLSHVNPAFRL